MAVQAVILDKPLTGHPAKNADKHAFPRLLELQRHPDRGSATLVSRHSPSQRQGAKTGEISGLVKIHA